MLESMWSRATSCRIEILDKFLSSISKTGIGKARISHNRLPSTTFLWLLQIPVPKPGEGKQSEFLNDCSICNQPFISGLTRAQILVGIQEKMSYLAMVDCDSHHMNVLSVVSILLPLYRPL